MCIKSCFFLLCPAFFPAAQFLDADHQEHGVQVGQAVLPEGFFDDVLYAHPFKIELPIFHAAKVGWEAISDK